jgi:copper oxidase (laccase) domain-containing protein
VSPLLPADWPAPPGVRAFSTLRFGAGRSQAPFDSFNLGNRTAANGDTPAQVDANRAELAMLAGLPSLPHWLRQVHGTGLAILTADCLPVVFAAADGSEVAAAHAGWRGLADGVLETTVAAMATPVSQIRAWMGPAAGPQAYEIGQAVFDAFTAGDPGAVAAFVATRPGHWRADLYALARRRLAAVGVTDVHGGGLCTISDPQRFFSHRRDARTGRLATLVWRSA